MKTFMKTFLLLFLMSGLTSCFFNGVQGNGNVISENRKIRNEFNSINGGNGLQIILNNSADISLEVEADENLHELIETYVENGTLYIKTNKNIGSAKAKKVHVFVDKLIEIDVHSGAEISSDNTFKADNFKINANSGGIINMQLYVHDLVCETSSGANLSLKGNSNSIVVSSSSGSNLNAYDLEVLTCDVDVSSGAQVKVNVRDSFKGSASSGGGIYYKGNPEIVNRSKSSGGTIGTKNSI
jgi:hypothetical protein